MAACSEWGRNPLGTGVENCPGGDCGVYAATGSMAETFACIISMGGSGASDGSEGSTNSACHNCQGQGTLACGLRYYKPAPISTYQLIQLCTARYHHHHHHLQG
jgi:hypothetical protein